MKPVRNTRIEVDIRFGKTQALGVRLQPSVFRRIREIEPQYQPVIAKILLEDHAAFGLAESRSECGFEIECQPHWMGIRAKHAENAFSRNTDEACTRVAGVGKRHVKREGLGRRGRAERAVLKGGS